MVTLSNKTKYISRLYSIFKSIAIFWNYNFGFGWFGLEPEDSDGDGRSNGDEIRIDCTLPGDVTSPNEATSWSRIKALYN